MFDKTTVYKWGTPEQLQALGTLTLYFGLVDKEITRAGAFLLAFRAGEDILDRHIQDLQRHGFKQRANRIGTLFVEMGKDDALDIPNLMHRVCQLADHRDDIVHGWIDIDHKRGLAVYKNKNKPSRSAEADAISSLNRQLHDWLEQFKGRSWAVMMTLMDRRHAEAKPIRPRGTDLSE